MGDRAVVGRDLDPGDLDVVVPGVADRGMEDPGLGLEDGGDQGADGAGLAPAAARGDPDPGGDVGLDGETGELHEEKPTQGTDNPRAAPRRCPREGSCTRADWTSVGGPGVG
jgi:hypothetical protein